MEHQGNTLHATGSVRLANFRDPARAAEARTISQLRRQCADAGLNPLQIQHVLRRARRSLRAGVPVGGTMEAVVCRAESLGASAFTLLDGLQATLRELVAGRSGATAYQAGVAAMKPRCEARRPLDGAA